MKSTPILFSTSMVQAILQGRKTQTRRIIKPQPEAKATEFNYNPESWPKYPWNARFKYPEELDRYEITNHYKCPYGHINDQIWVRETWMYAPNSNLSGKSYKYKASVRKQYLEEWKGEWKPSIHMPREACRLNLLNTQIRVEHLQDITEADALAEGVFFDSDSGYYFVGDIIMAGSATEAFKQLWILINGSDSWNANPWVWVVEFKANLEEK